MSKEPAGTDKNLIALTAGRWEPEVTTSPAVQVGRTSRARTFLCPQDIWTCVTSVSGLQAANTESLQDREQLNAFQDGRKPKMILEVILASPS